MSATRSSIALLVESLDLARGGAERATLNMARGLRDLGHPVTLVAPGDRSEQSLDIKLVRVPIKAKGRARRAQELAHRLPEVAREQGAECLIGCGKVAKVDLYWPHGGAHEAALRASTRAGRGPLRGQLALLARRLRPVETVFRSIEDSLFDRARRGLTRLVAISEKVRSDLHLHSGIPKHDIALCHNGAPIQHFQALPETQRNKARAEFCQRWQLPPEARLILFVAMNPRLKGAHKLAAALPELPKQAFLLYAGKQPRHRLSEQERSLGTVSDMKSLLALVDILALPTDYDPCSLITLEAMASALPIVTSHHNGAAELLNENQSVLFADDHKALVGALNMLIEEPGKAQDIGHQARRCAERWGPSEAASRLSQIIEAQSKHKPR